MMTRVVLHRSRIAVAILALAACAGTAHANGVLRNGIAPRAIALGGADVAFARDPLGAISANPAGLGFLGSSSELDLSVPAVLAKGQFSNVANTGSKLRSGFGVAPDGAFARRFPGQRLTLGFGIVPDAPLSAKWRYVDAPGGWNNASYGLQDQVSELLEVRFSAAAAYTVNPRFAVGATFGPVYNSNHLKAPYIFQSQPTLKGFKTLLDLKTNGWGWGGSVGFQHRPNERLEWGLSYTTPVTVHSNGDADGNAGAQLVAAGLGSARPDFHYDAEVTTRFPQRVSAGVSMWLEPGWRLPLQVDWIDWKNAFDELPVSLTNGNNSDINGVVGSNAMQDVVPLRWEDRVVFRGGLEHQIDDRWAMRAGYCYGRSPVPDGTLTPLTAAIIEHSVALGAGYTSGAYGIDLAYGLDIPASKRVGASTLQSGEYSSSRTEVALHWLALTASRRF